MSAAAAASDFGSKAGLEGGNLLVQLKIRPPVAERKRGEREQRKVQWNFPPPSEDINMFFGAVILSAVALEAGDADVVAPAFVVAAIVRPRTLATCCWLRAGDREEDTERKRGHK